MTVLSTITLPEHPDYRALIVSEEDADMPYDDGGSPIIRIDGTRPGHAEQVTETTSYVLAPGLVEAADRWALREPDTFERYARIFHGAQAFAWEPFNGRTNDYTYVTFDPADWRAEMGIAEGHNGTDLSEFRAWIDGDVCGIIVQRRETWKRVSDDEEREEWDEVDSCWGFYGSDTDYVRDEAREMLSLNADAGRG